MSGTYNDSLTDVSSDSFWEVGNYKRTVRRVDDGNRLCNDLMNCIHERARIEKAYAQQLTEWSKRWRQLIDKGPQYGTLEQAWIAVMTEAEKVSDLHMDVKSALMGEDFEKVKNWQKDAYHKQMIGGFKETKEAEDGFRKAQKPWSKKLKEVDTMKKAYHAACKEEKLATSRENNSKLESNSNPDATKKLQEKVEKCQQDVQKTKERYEKSLEELDKVTPQYMENMEQVFEQWQQFEEKRISFFKELLLDVKQHLDLSSNHKFQTVYHTLEDTVKSADAEEDLKWFRNNHGPGMHMNWPQFENMETPCTRLSKRKSFRVSSAPSQWLAGSHSSLALSLCACVCVRVRVRVRVCVLLESYASRECSQIRETIVIERPQMLPDIRTVMRSVQTDIIGWVKCVWCACVAFLCIHFQGTFNQATQSNCHLFLNGF
ncbi:protein kinase C and casein kinase substrate in neurons protein 2 isoform X5 [Alosa alosa]|uniref:protein kinase C and casein kinase substrate in neurons protein 2 isoform X5 n=1 Tax=Alosa alosa TaxID=278164 RepID=UPI0020153AC6|nr:protein kinase C and casein kinase substrate in neurons protein 2 isoform X5 [Alosa alosa]